MTKFDLSKSFAASLEKVKKDFPDKDNVWQRHKASEIMSRGEDKPAVNGNAFDNYKDALKAYREQNPALPYKEAQKIVSEQLKAK